MKKVKWMFLKVQKFRLKRNIYFTEEWLGTTWFDDSYPWSNCIKQSKVRVIEPPTKTTLFSVKQFQSIKKYSSRKRYILEKMQKLSDRNCKESPTNLHSLIQCVIAGVLNLKTNKLECAVKNVKCLEW